MMKQKISHFQVEKEKAKIIITHAISSMLLSNDAQNSHDPHLQRLKCGVALS